MVLHIQYWSSQGEKIERYLLDFNQNENGYNVVSTWELKEILKKTRKSVLFNKNCQNIPFTKFVEFDDFPECVWKVALAIQVFCNRTEHGKNRSCSNFQDLENSISDGLEELNLQFSRELLDFFRILEELGIICI